MKEGITVYADGVIGRIKDKRITIRKPSTREKPKNSSVPCLEAAATAAAAVVKPPPPAAAT